MARIGKWKSYHVKISTLERLTGTMLTSFREMYPEGDENIYGINDFSLFWDLPAKAGILGIVDQAQKGLF